MFVFGLVWPANFMVKGREMVCILYMHFVQTHNFGFGMILLFELQESTQKKYFSTIFLLKMFKTLLQHCL